jgi:hypothetical protein
MKTCDLCKSDFENLDELARACSRECQASLELLGEGTRIILETRPTEDPRIFFFPQSFGNLVDLYCVMSVKRAHSRSIRNQQEIGYKLSKLKKSITTMLGQVFYDPVQRSGVCQLYGELFRANSRMWAANDKARNKRYSEQERKDFFFSTIQDSTVRHKVIQQLDILHSGKSFTYKVYNGEEI